MNKINNLRFSILLNTLWASDALRIDVHVSRLVQVMPFGLIGAKPLPVVTVDVCYFFSIEPTYFFPKNPNKEFYAKENVFVSFSSDF